MVITVVGALGLFGRSNPDYCAPVVACLSITELSSYWKRLWDGEKCWRV